MLSSALGGADAPEATAGDAAFLNAFAAGIRPERSLSVVEWGEEHYRLQSDYAAEPGPWRVARTPYSREPLEALGPDSGVSVVALQWGAQLGKTTIGLVLVGYVIAHAPGPMLFVQPNVELVRRTSEQRIRPMIEDVPVLRERVRPVRSRDSGNTVQGKRFPGGELRMVGAESAVGLRSMSARYLFLDEVDGYPIDVQDEGDPIELAEARTATFGDRARELITSTPTSAGASRIETAFLDGDRRYYHVPCPFCGEFQPLVFERLKWEKNRPDTARYECVRCHTLIPEARKTEMLAAGRWVPTNPEATPGVRSYHLSSLYSPVGWRSWGKIAALFLKAKGNRERLKAFTNTNLAETFRESAETPDWEVLFNRREQYQVGTVPAGGLILTAGVDVQRDRLEYEVVAWGPNGGESWSVAYVVLDGDTSEREVWNGLDRLLDQTFPHASGARLPVARIGIDVGYNPGPVADWWRRKRTLRVIPMKGEDRAPTIIGAPRRVDVNRKGKKIRRGLQSWPFGTSVAKVELYGRLRLRPPAEGDAFPPGFCHFPLDYGRDYFQQLCAEELVWIRNRQGFLKPQWQKVPGRDGRNEVLDCRNMARAAAQAHGIDRWKPEDWAAIAETLGVDAAPPARQDAPATSSSDGEPAELETPTRERDDSPARRVKPRKPRSGGYLDRWRGH